MAENLDTFPNKKIWIPSAEDYMWIQRKREYLKAGKKTA
jgi:hypothetical protein